MGLSAATRLGPYEIQALLGAGGMGEVYRARDTKLGRDVAIKILPEVFTSDPERLARFEREARMLAALNHPHIGAIYGVEHTESVHALVLELVEGDTLAERLRRGPVPVTDARAIARQTAEALESAHEQGIVHRDLKPGNVKMTPDGTVKVLNFGLAKVGGQRRDGTRSLTIANRDRERHFGRRNSRHSRLHEPRAGAWQDDRQANRYLGVRVCTVRDAGRVPGFSGRHSLRCYRSHSRARAAMG